MKKIQLKDLSEAAQKVLSEVGEDESIVIEDETGRFPGQVVPYRDPTPEEEQRADESIKRFQKKVKQSFDEQGVTEDDLDKLLQEDD